MRNTKAAFNWIVRILRKNCIPFQVSGGCAARLYGVKRALYDIDFDIPRDRFTELAEAVKEHIVFGPAQYKNQNWDIFLMTLSYKGQEMDFSALRAKIFDRSERKWRVLKANLATAKTMEAYGLKVLVVNKEELIRYKKVLSRDEDLTDVEQLSR